MATSFVYSGAAGTNDGSSWANAWTSLASSSGVAAGDVVKVHKTHSETGLSANINWSNGTVDNPVRIICVDKDAADALATGAIVSWGTANTGPQGSLYTYGMFWASTASSLTFSVANDGWQVHESGKMTVTGATGVLFSGARARMRLINEEMDFSGASSTAVSFNWAAILDVEWVGGIYRCRATQTNLLALIGTKNQITFRGVQFVGTVTNLVAPSSQNNGEILFVGCSAPVYTNIFATSTPPAGNSGRSTMVGFVAGTITAPAVGPGVLWRHTGTVGGSLTRYRTGGAADGSQSYCWEMISNASALAFVSWLDSPPIVRWVDAGSQVLKVYVASGASLNNDECWIEVISPSEAVTPTSQSTFRTTRCAPLATPAALATDASSTWNGTGVGTMQYATVTIAPTIAGRVMVRVFCAKAGTTVYVDPVIEVAGNAVGKSRMFEGVQSFCADTGLIQPGGFTGGNQRTS